MSSTAPTQKKDYAQSKKVMTPEFRVSFPFIFKQGETPTGKKYWGLVMIFDSDADFTEMKKAVKEVLTIKFPTGEYPTGRTVKLSPFRKGTPEEYDLSKRPEYKDKVICTAKTYNAAPGLINTDRSEIIDPSDFYPGCYARATVNAYWFDVNGNKGITWSLQNLMKTRDGEPLVSRPTAEDDFQSLFSGETLEDNSDLFDL